MVGKQWVNMALYLNQTDHINNLLNETIQWDSSPRRSLRERSVMVFRLNPHPMSDRSVLIPFPLAWKKS